MAEIRLSKLTKQFGIGLQTLVDFLNEKGAGVETNPNAKKFDSLTYREMLDKQLKVIDLTAASFCMENKITSYLFELKDPENIYRVVCGENAGTEIHN